MNGTDHGTDDGPDDATRVAAAVRARLRDIGRRPVLVCLDGRSGSGKTTLARRLARVLREGGTSVTVLHLDDVYPGWDGLRQAADLLGERLLPALRAGDEPTYPSWSWVRDRPSRDVVVPSADVVLVEGVGSAGRAARAVADLVVWLDAPTDVRHQRAMARDGDAYAPHWQRWAAQEDAYLAAERPAESADLRLRTATDDAGTGP